MGPIIRAVVELAEVLEFRGVPIARQRWAFRATTVTVISKTSHQLLATHHINPTKNYWPNKQKNPGQ